MNVDPNDVNITKSLIEIPIGDSEACVQLEAIDDIIVENEEEFVLVATAVNRYDVLDQNVTIFVSDNDGMIDMCTLCYSYRLILLKPKIMQLQTSDLIKV